MNAAHSLENCH